MKVYISPNNPIDSDIDELTLIPEDKAESDRLRTLLNKYETTGFGSDGNGTIYHVSIKLTEKQKEDVL